MGSGEAASLAWVLGVGGGLGSIGVTAWLVFVIVDGFRRRQQVRAAADLQQRLLEKIGSAQEFAAFLATDEGGRFLDAIAVDRRVAQMSVLRLLQIGIVAFVIGITLVLGGVLRQSPDGLLALGLVTVALGAGLLVASGLSHVAARRMGLIHAGGHPAGSSRA